MGKFSPSGDLYRRPVTLKPPADQGTHRVNQALAFAIRAERAGHIHRIVRGGITVFLLPDLVLLEIAVDDRFLILRQVEQVGAAGSAVGALAVDSKIRHASIFEDLKQTLYHLPFHSFHPVSSR